MLYIAATTEVVSMVLDTERSESKQPQALNVALVAGSGSQDPDPVEGPKPTLSHEPQMGSRLLEMPSGPEDQEASGS
jgi:hypothetical protein